MLSLGSCYVVAPGVLGSSWLIAELADLGGLEGVNDSIPAKSNTSLPLESKLSEYLLRVSITT